MNVGDVAKRAGVVTGVVAGVAGAVYAGERAVAARIRRGGPGEPSADDMLLPDVDEDTRIPTHDGGELYAIERGTGTPIVFAHGVTLTSQVWARQFRSMPAAGFRAVAFDGRGHGESTAGDSGHSIDNLAADLRCVLEALDLKDAIVVGHSMGGMAVQGLAVHHPEVLAERVAGIVLLSTEARSFASDAQRLRGGLDRATAVAPTIGAVFRQRNLGLLIARLGFGDDPDPRCVEVTRQMLAGCSRETLREASRSLLTLDFVDDLPHLDVPTLVVVGSADLVTPPRESQVIADLVPGAELVELPRAGHMLMYERTEELDRLVIDFARRCLAERALPARVARRRPDAVAVRAGVRQRHTGAMLTVVPGVRVGHWTGDGTGVTVVVLPEGRGIGSCEVRGGAPATRETALLEPGRTVERIDMIVLTGGSAFGLAAADGVMRALAEHGVGFPTRGGPVPIVPAAAIYDLVEANGPPPGAEEGRTALADAVRRGPDVPFPLGRVGAGAGATIGTWKGPEHGVPGGVGSASRRDGDVVVGALAVVNAVGDVIAADGTVLAGSTAPDGTIAFPPVPEPLQPLEHTTLVVVVTNATCTKAACRLLAESAHHGLVRVIHPSHTRHDGDVAFAVSTGEVDGDAVNLDRLRVLATEVTADAVRSAVAPRPAED